LENLSQSFSGLLLCFVDFSGEFKQVTPALAKVLGRTLIDLPIQPNVETGERPESQSVWPNLLDLVHPQEHQAIESALSQLSHSIDEVSFECRCQSINGNYHWLLWRATAATKEHGFYAQITEMSAYKSLTFNDAAMPPPAANEYLLSVLDSLDALIYVADIETYEILYENQYGQRTFGNLVGQVCWQAFLQKNNPCPFCSKILLKEEQPNVSHRWECYSTLVNKWYLVHDRAIRWVDGRIARLEIAYDITERKQIEQSLKMSQERYALAVGVGKTGVWDWNLKTNDMYLDANLKALLGFTDIELPNRLEAWMALIHPDDVIRLRQASRDYLQQRIPRFEEEYRILDEEGQIRWMIVRGRTMLENNGRAYRMVGTNTDITERKQLQEHLQEQQRLWLGVAQVTHTLLTVPDDENAIGSALKILGHLTSVDRAYIFENYTVPDTGESVINQSFTWVNKKYKPYNTPIKLKNLSYAHYLPGWYESLEKDEPIAGLVKEFPEPIRSLLASYQVISILIVPIHFNGQFWGFIGLDDCYHERQWTQYEILALKVIGDSIRGSLARQQFKESLRQSEAKFRSIIENSLDAIIVCDKEGLIRFVNPAAEKLYKASIGRLIGKSFCAPFDVEKKAEFKFKDLEGGHHVGELQLSQIEWEGEQLTLASLRDITERKQAEIDLQRNKEAAEAANRFKGLFLAAMSHEIRTPMNGVLGLTKLLNLTTLTRQQQHYIKMIENSGQVLLRVINDILDFSRMEAGKGLVLNIIEFEPRNLVEEMVNLFAAEAQGKGLEILCQLPPRLPKTLLGDSSRLRQILNNLLGNAIKFTKSGEVLLRLSVSSETSTKAVLLFEVIDTGIGIKPNVSKNLFQLYFRNEESGSQYQGAGLGLFISRQLVYKMGGEIDLTSDYGKGSTFWFKLPLDKPSLDNHEPLAQKSLPETILETENLITIDNGLLEPSKLHQLKLLIIDDNATCRQILVDETRAWQMEVVAVGECQACLAILRDAAIKGAPFQLALIDVEIPKLEDGLALLQEIQADIRLANLKMVMMTTLQRILEPLVLKKLAGYLNKPIFQAELLKSLLAAINYTHDHEVTKNSCHRAEKETLEPHWQVLLAEDNVINQEVAKEMLNQLGCHVQVAANGFEALEAVEQQDFDMIFMDCSMPELDGYTASRKIREREKQQGNGSHIPIIAFTADVMPSTRDRCLSVGMDDYLTKPLIISELNNKLETWLKDFRQRALTTPTAETTLKNRLAEKNHNRSAEPESLPDRSHLQTEHAAEIKKPIPPSPITDEDSLLDVQVLNDMRRNLQPSKLHWIIDLYLQELPDYLAKLQQAITSQDSESLYSAAHKFKGASAILGVQRIVILCKQLEKFGREGGGFDKAEELLALLEIECESTKPALEEQKAK